MMVNRSGKARVAIGTVLGVLAGISGAGFLAGSLRALSGTTDTGRNILVVAAVTLVLSCIASCLVEGQGGRDAGPSQ